MTPTSLMALAALAAAPGPANVIGSGTSETFRILAASIGAALRVDRPCVHSTLRDLGRGHDLEELNRSIAGFADARIRRRLIDLAYRALRESSERPLGTRERAWLGKRGFRLIEDRFGESSRAGCDLVISMSDPVSDGRYAALSITYFYPNHSNDNATRSLLLYKQGRAWRILIGSPGFTIVV